VWRWSTSAERPATDALLLRRRLLCNPVGMCRVQQSRPCHISVPFSESSSCTPPPFIPSAKTT